MFTLLNALHVPSADTPDTGTFADGAIDIPVAEAIFKRRQDKRRAAYARDYALDRTVQTGAIGYA